MRRRRDANTDIAPAGIMASANGIMLDCDELPVAGSVGTRTTNVSAEFSYVAPAAPTDTTVRREGNSRQGCYKLYQVKL